MIIALHVIVALLSMAWTTFGYIRPTRKNLYTSYALVGLTFASGFYMVWSEPAQMLRACMSGITYLAIVSAGIVLTHKKLVRLQNERVDAHQNI